MLRAFAKYLRPNVLNRQGYTIDQTILIVAIIAILITLIIITIGWQLINRTSGTKLGSQLKQVEDAVTQFYAAQRVFPHQAFATAPTAPATGNMLVLAAVTPAGATLLPTIQAANLSNLLAGFRINTNVSLRNSYGGDISMLPATVNTWTSAPAANTYLVLQFAQVPLSDAQEADRAIDGQPGGDTGRLVYSNTSCLPASAGGAVGAVTTGTNPTVFACYVASAIN
jgi:Tfp pilus assembly protein PilE